MTQRKLRASVVILCALGVFGATSAESVKGCSGGGGSSTSQHAVENEDVYREWCKHVKEGDNSTYVYRYTDHKGHEGYKKGRRNIQRYIDDPAYSTKRVC